MHIEIREIISQSLMITGFVFAMMLLIEYINVITREEWQKKLSKTKFGQILLAVFLGIIPGCLGSFTIVSLYSHGIVSFGALTAAMIATMGDEAYVMMSLFPAEALIITAFTFVIGFAVGVLIDYYFKNQGKLLPESIHNFEVHSLDRCECLPNVKQIKSNLKSVSFPRGLLLALLSVLLISVLIGEIAGDEEEWVKLTLMFVIALAGFIVIIVPDHFLEEHLWEHVLKKHLLRIFLWTFGALLIVAFIQNFIDVPSLIEKNYFTVLLIAVLIGLIPESGPHLVFVTLFAAGSLPFGILLASSIVQDGHGTLPLISFSRKSFAALKLINAAVGFAAGYIYYLFLF